MGITADLAVALDPVRFAEGAGIICDDWQAAVLRSDASRTLLNVTRQGGKSLVVACLAAHTALYQPGSLVLIVSPSQRQSGETFKKVTTIYRAVGKPVPAESESALGLTLANGSRVIALPGSETTLRGYSGVTLLILDEAARIEDEMYLSLRPMVAVSGGRIILLSTPWGKRGFFHREWTEGGPSWQRYEIPASHCPRIPASFLAEERTALGPWFFQQEYECEFMETSDQVFGHDLVMSAISSAIVPLFGGA